MPARSRAREVISYMDLNLENPAEALPRLPVTPPSKALLGRRKAKAVESKDSDEDAVGTAKAIGPNADDSLPKIHRLARKLLEMDPYHRFIFESPTEADLDSNVTVNMISDCIKIVCISDTLGKRIAVPDGDLLIHAGNITMHGSFNEMQEMLDWLNTLPHQHKVLVAGNHDMILDETYCASLRHYGHGLKDKEELNWGRVLYLQDQKAEIDVWIPCSGSSKVRIAMTESGVVGERAHGQLIGSVSSINTTTGKTESDTVKSSEPDFIGKGSPSSPEQDDAITVKQNALIKSTTPQLRPVQSGITNTGPLTMLQHRRFVIFGTPWTSSPHFPQLRLFCHNAFQTSDSHLRWEKHYDNLIPKDVNIVVAHCPPMFHGDSATAPGSMSLLREIHRVKPWLVVSGRHPAEEGPLESRGGRNNTGLKGMPSISEADEPDSGFIEDKNYPVSGTTAETIVMDSTRVAYEQIMSKRNGVGRWMLLAGMAVHVLGRRARIGTQSLVRRAMGGKSKVLVVRKLTTFVNASAKLYHRGMGKNGAGHMALQTQTVGEGNTKAMVFYMRPECAIEIE